jgi:hypothetical protein
VARARGRRELNQHTGPPRWRPRRVARDLGVTGPPRCDGPLLERLDANSDRLNRSPGADRPRRRVPGQEYLGRRQRLCHHRRERRCQVGHDLRRPGPGRADGLLDEQWVARMSRRDGTNASMTPAACLTLDYAATHAGDRCRQASRAGAGSGLAARADRLEGGRVAAAQRGGRSTANWSVISSRLRPPSHPAIGHGPDEPDAGKVGAEPRSCWLSRSPTTGLAQPEGVGW